ncbi:MAG: Flp pilus assembly complex ATPase component TadA, partial [Xanthomonadales bacterium]|nr:Flp pilus assembly complex ATPase component TadA [Xanthomonadales bacterium]
STLHTNSAAGGVTRLLDMGVADYLLTSTINGILAQRLVRRLDPETAEPYEAMPEVIAEFKLDQYTDERPIRLWRPKPSTRSSTGYHGRTTIMEFLVMTDAIRRMVMQHADMGVIEAEARKEGMFTMYEDGIRKALQGVTTIEEVLRVTQEV